MVNEAEVKKNEDAKAAAEAAKSRADSSSQDSKAKGEEKTYNQADADAYATNRIAEHYKELNAKLSANGIELAKLRPLEAENVTLRTSVTKLENEADERDLEGAKADPTHVEVIQMRRDLRTKIGEHNETVRTFTIEKAALDADRGAYDAWNDQHNPSNPESAISVATKHKVDAKDLEGIPKEAREVIAKKLAETAAIPAVDGDKKEPKSPVDDGLGQGGEQLTGQAGARAWLDKAKGKTK